MMSRFKREIDKILTIEELKKMLEASKKTDFKHFILLYVAFVTGARLNELIVMKKSDIDTSNCLIQRKLLKKKKNRPPEYRSLAIATTMMTPIIKWLDVRDSEWLLPSHASNHIHYRTAQEIFIKYHFMTGCKDNHTFHSLRHLHGSLAKEATGDLGYVQWRLGHQPLGTSGLYALGENARKDRQYQEEKFEPMLRNIYKMGDIWLQKN